MADLPFTKPRLIVGLGATGLATARYCQRKQWAFDVCDTRDVLPGLDQIQADFPHAKILTGPLSAARLSDYQQLVVSPGVALATPEIQSAITSGCEAIGDIELFVRECQQPVIAITGSNGKSTVTLLVAHLLEQAGYAVQVGGNIGIPVLDLLEQPTPDFYVLELSSFQLETTTSLHARAAVLLNFSEDHMDRYDGMADYLAAKQRIFINSQSVVVNRDDVASVPPVGHSQTYSFGLSEPDSSEHSGYALQVGESQGMEGWWIVRNGQPLVHSSAVSLKGLHNLSNAMAALALLDACEVDIQAALPALATFQGLDHRCQFVERVDGVDFINDSKGTNVGSTIAAIQGLIGSCDRLHLLLGGDDKGQDFSPLCDVLKSLPVSVYCFGRAGSSLHAEFSGASNSQCFETLDQAFATAAQCARNKDVVLLSPACASFDQYPNYMARGQHFVSLVQGMSV